MQMRVAGRGIPELMIPGTDHQSLTTFLGGIIVSVLNLCQVQFPAKGMEFSLLREKEFSRLFLQESIS